MQRAESQSSGPAALWVLDKQLPILEQAIFKIQIKSCCCHGVYWFHWDHLDAGTCLSLPFCRADANFYFQINIINAFNYYLSQSNLQLPLCYACCLRHPYLYLFWASFSVFLLRLRLDFCLLWKPFILQCCGGRSSVLLFIHGHVLALGMLCTVYPQACTPAFSGIWRQQKHILWRDR